MSKELRSFTDADAALIWELGKAALHGMREVEGAERFTGTVAIHNTYTTHFPVAGREWRLTLEPYRE